MADINLHRLYLHTLTFSSFHFNDWRYSLPHGGRGGGIPSFPLSGFRIKHCIGNRHRNEGGGDCERGEKEEERVDKGLG
jgi:hypothetical protein